MPRPPSPHPSVTPRILKSMDIRRYWDAGYINISGVLDPDLLRRMIDRTIRLADEARTMREPDHHFDLGPDQTPNTPKLRRVSSPTEIDPVYEEAAFNSTAADSAADLVGGIVKIYHAKINFMLQGNDTVVAQWHQDWPHFPHTNTSLVAVSLPMTKRTAENGAIRIVAGSHKRGPLSVWRNGSMFLPARAM